MRRSTRPTSRRAASPSLPGTRCSERASVASGVFSPCARLATWPRARSRFAAFSASSALSSSTSGPTSRGCWRGSALAWPSRTAAISARNRPSGRSPIRTCAKVAASKARPRPAIAMAIVVIASRIGCVIASTGEATKMVTSALSTVRRATRMCIARPSNVSVEIVRGRPCWSDAGAPSSGAPGGGGGGAGRAAMSESAGGTKTPSPSQRLCRSFCGPRMNQKAWWCGLSKGGPSASPSRRIRPSGAARTCEARATILLSSRWSIWPVTNRDSTCHIRPSVKTSAMSVNSAEPASSRPLSEDGEIARQRFPRAVAEVGRRPVPNAVPPVRGQRLHPPPSVRR